MGRLAPGKRQFGFETLRTPESLERFLRDPSAYPLSAKPVDGMYSMGALSLAGPQGERVRLTTGEWCPLTAIVDFIAGFGGEGFLLQDRVEPAAPSAGPAAARSPRSASWCCSRRKDLR